MKLPRLRLWQQRCIKAALHHFSTTPHFLCQATPGAGKTRLAAELACCLFENNQSNYLGGSELGSPTT